MHNNEKKADLFNYINAISSLLPALFWCGLMLGFEDVPMAFTTIICALIHEVGHILYLVLFTSSCHSIKSVVFGLKIKAVKFLSYKDELLLYLSGPLANLILGFVFWHLSVRDSFFYTMSIINIATAISNLLPIEGYDGYGILRTIIEKHFPMGLFLRLLSIFSTLLVFLFCILSIYLIDRYGGGYWIFAVFFVQMIKQLQKI